MKFSDYLLDPRATLPEWKLLRDVSRQLLPCRLPFEGCQQDVFPAVQGYAMGMLEDARRFVELRRLGSSANHADNWSLRLVESLLHLEMGEPKNAWSHLQAALDWQHGQQVRCGQSDSRKKTLRHYLGMATVAQAASRLDLAEQFASDAVRVIDEDMTCCVGEVLQDSRADAMLVFAAIRLQQGKVADAESLLQLAYDAHIQAGDVEQMTVDLILLSDVDLYSGDSEAAQCLLHEADQFLSDELDVARHHRTPALREAIRDRMLIVRRRSSLLQGAGPSLN